MASVLERQKALAERRKKQGKKQFTIWADSKVLERLKKSYPGERGGIRWTDVMDAAIQAQSNAVQK